MKYKTPYDLRQAIARHFHLFQLNSNLLKSSMPTLLCEMVNKVHGSKIWSI